MNRSKSPVIYETARTTWSDRGRYSDAGDTLVEVLLALIVLGLASVALIIAFSTSISASAEHRNLATDDTVLATATQVTIANIQSQPSLFSCSPQAPLASFPGYTSGITLPSPYAGKYTVLYATSNPVQYWNTSTESFGSACQADEPLLITIYLQGTSVTNSFVIDYPIGSSNALTAGSAAQLVFIQQPVGGYAGSPFTTQPIVEIVTAGGSPSTVTTDLSPIILTLTQGTGVLAGCTGNEILGVVTFSGCTVGTGGSNFEITASDGSLNPATSNPFSVNPSSFHLVFTSQPVAAGSGSAFATAPVVTILNTVNSTDISWSGTITLTLSGGALSALPGKTCNFTTATTITLTPFNGVVTMPSGCAFSGGYYYDASRSPPQTATQYTMAATANPTTLSDAAVPASSNTFAVTGFGTATQLAFTSQPTGVASATAATPFSGQPTVAVEDAFGNVVTSASNVIGLAINSGAQGVLLSNCNIPSPTSAGLYVFSGCEGSTYGTNLTLTASSPGLASATSAKFSITNVATQLLFTTQPVAGNSGSVLAIEPVLTVEDSTNRVVTAATTPIAFNPVVPSSGTMSACTSLVPQSGVIKVANCAFAGVVGTPYTIVATSGSLTSAPSSSFTPTGPGPATQLVFATSPVAGVSGTAFTTQPIVNVEDSAGNVVTTSNAVITLTPSGGTLAACSGLTASAGVVTVSNCTFAGVVLTPYTLTATSGPLTSKPSTSFSPTYAGVTSQIVLTGCSTAIATSATCTASATIEDVYGNIETLDNSSIMTFSQVPLGGTVTGLGSPTVSAGGASTTMTGAAQGLVGIIANADSLTSNTLMVTVNAPTTTTVTSSSNPSVAGQSINLIATVSVASPDTGVPTGNIEFLDNGTPIGVCGGASGLLVNGSGQATCLASWSSVGTQSITAAYLGNAGAYYLASTSSALTQTVNQASTTTAVTSSPNPSVVGQTVTYTATVSVTSPGSGNPSAADTVTFKDGASVIACGGGSVAFNGTTATCTVTYANTTGSPHSITAVFGGDVNYLTSTSSALSQTVNQASTTTAVTSNSSTSVPGQTVTYTATVAVTAPGSGTPLAADTITFKDGASVIACGGGSVAFNGTSATCTVTYATTTGSPHSITAVFGGDANYLTSTSSALIQTVNQALTTTAVTSSPNPSVPFQTVTYTATVAATAPGTGTPSAADTMTFKDGASVIACGGGSVAFNGTTATCTVTYNNTTGSPHSITATFGGDANYLTSTSPAYGQTVNRASTTTAVTSSPNPSVPFQTVTYTATVAATAPGTGTPLAADTITFKDGASVIACGGGSVTFNGTTATCTVTYNNTTGSPHSITAVFGGDANYLTSTSPVYIQTVNRASTTTAVTSSPNPSVSGQTVTITATVAVTAPGSGTPLAADTITFKDGASVIACGGGSVAFNGTTATCTYASTTAGAHSITAVFGGDANYLTSTSPAYIQTVNRASTVTTVTSSSSTSVPGQTVTYTATVAATAPGTGTPSAADTMTFKDGASVIACGGGSVAFNGTTATCTVTYANTTGSPHSITAVFGGDVNYLTSTSSVLTQTVAQASTTTAVTSSPNPSVPQTVTYTATVAVTAPGTGTPLAADTITFKDGASVIACGGGSVAFNGTSATCTVTYATTTGSPHSITAVFGGDANYLTSTSSALIQTVNHALTTTAVTSSPNPSVPFRTVTYTATVSVTTPGSGTPLAADTMTFKDGASTVVCGGGSVAFNGTTATCTVTYANTTGSPHSITAVFGGDANYATSTSPAYIQTVNHASTTTAVTSSSNPIARRTTVTYTATVSVTAPGSGTPLAADTLTFKDGGSVIACGSGSVAFNGTTATCTTSYNNANGSPHSITAVFGGDANYLASTSPVYPQTVT